MHCIYVQTFNKCVKTVSRFKLHIDDNLMSIVLLLSLKTFTQLEIPNARLFISFIWGVLIKCAKLMFKTSNVSYSVQIWKMLKNITK